MSSVRCPYFNCDLRSGDASCSHALSLPQAPELLAPCPVRERSRILHRCPKTGCRTPNQLAAAHCRTCGDRLPTPHALPCEEWVQKAERPTSVNFEEIPQPTVVGDLFVTMQRFDGLTPKFVLTNIATGGNVALLDYPGQPGLFASPVFVKDRIYSFAQSQLLEYGLWSLSPSPVTIPVPHFDPSPYCRPVHFSRNGDDFIVVGGRREILVFSIPNEDAPHRIPIPKMPPEDALMTPVWHPGVGVILGTRMGGLYVLRGDLDRLIRVRVPGTRSLFSALSYSPVNQSTALECVFTQTCERRFLVLKVKDGKLESKIFPAPNPRDTYPPQNFSRLVFAPLMSGQYFIFTSKILPGEVYFVNHEGIHVALVQGADLDEVGSVVKGTSVYCVANGLVQRFDASPANQTVREISIPMNPPRSQTIVMARPVQYGGALFVQKEEALMCLRV